jgi:peptidoglycan hydrolase-like amidase
VDNSWPTTSSYTPQFNLTLPNKHVSEGQTLYGINNLTVRTVITASEEVIPSVWFTRDDNSTLELKQQWTTDIPLIFQVASNPWGLAKNITVLVDRLARSMTNIILEGQNAGTQQLNITNGTDWTDETHVYRR